MISPDAKIRPNPQVVVRELAGDEGGVLLHLDSGRYHGINVVGLLIWEALDGERTVSDIVEVVRARIADAPAELEDDVAEFLVAAQERELVFVD